MDPGSEAGVTEEAHATQHRRTQMCESIRRTGGSLPPRRRGAGAMETDDGKEARHGPRNRPSNRPKQLEHEPGT